MTAGRKSGRPAKVPGEKSTKEKIFDAAVDLFAERGYEGVSIRDIAGAVGIKESSVYKHYASKDAILDSVFEYLKARLYPQQASGVDMDAMLDALTFEQVLEARAAFYKTDDERPLHGQDHPHHHHRAVPQQEDSGLLLWPDVRASG
ncbi:TetR/AcrR family transcriptional regulator [Methanocella sp. MCL-LM]|uniref:TetR/AcrR family transcriptional regulator n=1 Tax=Methanocella sp. MCL-LM TaxID=3412035 RepID=UPI003C767E98